MKPKAMQLRPLHDRILVRRIEQEEKTKGGLIIPDTAKEKPQEARVIAVGKGRVNEDGKPSTPEPRSRSKATNI